MLTKKPPMPKGETKTPARASKKSQGSLFDGTALEPPAGNNISTNQAPARSTAKTSRIIIKSDVGFHNHLTIRGKGANLSWTKGIPLKNKGADEWVWETDAPFSLLEYKVLINDHYYENGDNHILKQGETVHRAPHF